MVDPTAAATTVSLSAIGAWLILRLLKSFSGRIKDEEERVRRQERQNEEMRDRILVLEKEVATCHAERAYNQASLKEAIERIKALEMKDLG